MGDVLVRDGLRFAQLDDLAETVGERAGRVTHHLPREDVAHGVEDHLRLLVAVVALQLREVLKAQADSHTVRTGRGDEVVQPPEVDCRELVDDN